MAGLSDVHVIIAPFRAAMADIRTASDKAAMWAVRESARQTGRAAKKHAPVKTGRYKKSIKSSKRLQKVDGGYRLMVGPRGPIVHLYAQKVEAGGSVIGGSSGRDNRGRFTAAPRVPGKGPMSQGFDDVRASFGDIHEKALAKALAKYL